jgi:dTDP-D-glucose 4,6-dehydratase
VKDLARAIVAVMKADPEAMRGQIFNVGDSRLNVTIGQLGKLVQGIVQAERPVEVEVIENSADQRNYAVSFDKIKTTLGLEASVTLEEGLREIVKEFKKGTYNDYKGQEYSNVAVTRKAVEDFRDPLQVMNLYRPLADRPANTVPA